MALARLQVSLYVLSPFVLGYTSADAATGFVWPSMTTPVDCRVAFQPEASTADSNESKWAA